MSGARSSASRRGSAMPESRPISKGAISGAVPLSAALLRGGGKLGPKMIAKLGRTTESKVAADSADALLAATRGPRGPSAGDLESLIKALVGADIFSGFLLQRPGAREALLARAFGKESLENMETFRLLDQLGMPVDKDPRLGLTVVRTGRDRPAWARWAQPGPVPMPEPPGSKPMTGVLRLQGPRGNPVPMPDSTNWGSRGKR